MKKKKVNVPTLGDVAMLREAMCKNIVAMEVRLADLNSQPGHGLALMTNYNAMIQLEMMRTTVKVLGWVLGEPLLLPTFAAQIAAANAKL
jgi:hypothetical protein